MAEGKHRTAKTPPWSEHLGRRIGTDGLALDGLLGAMDVARLLGCHHSHVMKLIERRLLPAVKLSNRWRIPASAIRELLDAAERHAEISRGCEAPDPDRTPRRQRTFVTPGNDDGNAER